jgi:hypothetical protein
MMAGQAHRQTRSTHAPYWCDDCGRAHTGTHADAQGILGASGVTRYGVSYVWCSREGAYHISTEPRATALTMMRNPIPHAFKVRLRWTTNVAQPSRPVVTRKVSARVFAQTYDAQRSYAGTCVAL